MLANKNIALHREPQGIKRKGLNWTMKTLFCLYHHHDTIMGHYLFVYTNQSYQLQLTGTTKVPGVFCLGEGGFMRGVFYL